MIADWLWGISPTSFKAGNKKKTERDVYKLYQVWENNIENFRQHAFKVRKQRFPQFANSNALYLLGKERGFNRFKNETEEEFRSRVINAISWYKKAGTVKGIKEILALYGFENVKITPILQTDPTKWAEFLIEADIPNGITEERFSLISEILIKIKPTHEKLNSLNIYLTSDFKQNRAAAMLSGHDITVYPYQVKELQLSAKDYTAIGYQAVHTTTIYPATN
ncbi:Phage tail protein (Tail_P2_I) [Persephonella hydrogeniphila]|uniref:Phage tail protein (Tail_P2_I) n=1 Tax=Persephonella hydrogeniphila TaxID=198703 RepID=A0A285NFM9_9AQUI|nr:phage tail protein [Persephonella hydrogeniphila]SNZ08314.1 Phage tail protein (Tail_P2_I) [Persephonella hydrogeniphila]